MSMRENNSATLSRPLGVTAIAVVWTLFGVFEIWESYFDWNAASGGLTAVEDGAADIAAAVNTVIALVLLIQLACIVGLFRMRNWARRGGRFLAVLFLLSSSFAVYAFFGEDSDASAASGMLDAVSFAFSLWAWIYLGRREVVARFMLADGKSAQESAGELLGVTIIAAVWTLFGIVGLSYLVWNVASGEWKTDFGITTLIFVSVFCFVQLTCAVGLFRMQNWARWWVRLVSSLGTLSFVVSYVNVLFGAYVNVIFGEDFALKAATFIFLLWTWFYLSRREVVARFMFADGKNAQETADEIETLRSKKHRGQDSQSGKGGL